MLILIDVQHIFPSNYSSVLTSTSHSYIHSKSSDLSYYEILEMNITESGFYTIRSSSKLNLYGFIYNGTFLPSEITTNLIDENDDGGRYEQFLFYMYLDAHTSYELVVTTRDAQITGNFSILAFGPSKINFIYKINTTEIIQSIYQSALTTESRLYSSTECNPLTYYEAVEINVRENGSYIFTCRSELYLSLSGSIYNDTFDPSNPNANLLEENSYYQSNSPFKLSQYLYINKKYVLVISATAPNRTANFTLIVSGTNHVVFARLNNMKSIVRTTYSSELTQNSPIYGGGLCKSLIYHYEPIELSVIEDGFYTISVRDQYNLYVFFYINYFNLDILKIICQFNRIFNVLSIICSDYFIIFNQI